MTLKNKFSNPPISSAEEFISEAENRTKITLPVSDFPLAGGPRAGMLTLRLTQREVSVLRWLAENSPMSQHSIILDAAKRKIQEEYRKLSGDSFFLL